MNRLLEAVPSTNGVAKKATRVRRGKAEVAPAKQDWARIGLTGVMGCGIPLLSLALSTCAGTLARSGLIVLSITALILMACVLTVSLSHLAWAIQDITRSERWASWLLAVAFDLCLVFGEAVSVFAGEVGLGGIVWSVMIFVCLLSQVLNCWAFFNHPAK